VSNEHLAQRVQLAQLRLGRRVDDAKDGLGDRRLDFALHLDEAEAGGEELAVELEELEELDVDLLADARLDALGTGSQAETK
jgi:hypothetical protein